MSGARRVVVDDGSGERDPINTLAGSLLGTELFAEAVGDGTINLPEPGPPSWLVAFPDRALESARCFRPGFPALGLSGDKTLLDL